jgi:exopolysaccharide production protein ExoZ
MLNNIQTLRALAALLVVFVHVGAISHLALGETLRFGHSGVDLFFVISGFVMVYTYAQRPLSPGGFLLNRVIRVVPLYWTFTILLFVVAVVSGYPLMQASRPTTIQFLQSLVFVPFRQASGVVEPLYFLGWTLNYEMMFYVLFALAIALGRGRLERVVGLAVAAVVGMAAIGSVLTPTSTWLSFYTSPILLAFAVGMGIAFAVVRGVTTGPRVAVAMLAVGAIVLLFAPQIGLRIHSPWLGLASGVIVAGAVALEQRGWRTQSRAALLLGAASYALYLSHPFATAIGDRISARVPAGIAFPIALLATLLIAIPLALAIHLAFERPVTALLRRLIDHRRPIVDVSEDALVGATAPTVAANEGRPGSAQIGG